MAIKQKAGRNSVNIAGSSITGTINTAAPIKEARTLDSRPVVFPPREGESLTAYLKRAGSLDTDLLKALLQAYALQIRQTTDVDSLTHPEGVFASLHALNQAELMELFTYLIEADE